MGVDVLTQVGLPQWAQALIWIASAVTALGVIWRGFIRPTSRLITALEKFGPTVLEIAREFKPNSGESLRDSVDSIHDKLDRSADWLEDLDTKVNHLDERLTQVEGYPNEASGELEE